MLGRHLLGGDGRRLRRRRLLRRRRVRERLQSERRERDSAGNILITFLAPATKTVAKATDPSCATVGVCGGNGFCPAGKSADHCTASADCDQPVGTCRVVANDADTPLTLRKPVKLNKTVPTSFEPLTPRCSRKVDIVLDPAAHTSTLKLNVSGTVRGKTRRDTDNFRYR